MKNIILLSIALGVMFSSPSYSATEKNSTLSTSNISMLRTHSVSHSNSLAQNMTMFWVTGLQDGCFSLYIYTDKDPFLYSTILAGVTKESINTFKVYYIVDEDRGPWGDNGSCKLTSFSIVK